MRKILFTMAFCLSLGAQENGLNKARPKARKPKTKPSTEAPESQPETGENLVNSVKRVVNHLKSESTNREASEEIQRKLTAVAQEADRALRTLQSVPNAKLQKDLKQQIHSAMTFVRSLGENVLKDVDSTVKRLNDMSQSIE